MDNRTARIAELRRIAEEAARSSAASAGRASLDLSIECLEDFFAVYTAGDRITDPRHLAAWRRSLHVALMQIRPTRQATGAVTIGAPDFARFLAYLHRADVQVSDADLRRRRVAFLKALPHVAAQ